MSSPLRIYLSSIRDECWFGEMIFFKDNAPIGTKTPTVLNHQAFRLKFMGELRLMVAAAATSGMIRMSGVNFLPFASGCSGKRLDCWTLDLVLGVHLTFHCYLCILARLRDSRLGDEIEILSSCLLLLLPSESLQNCDCQILSITLAVEMLLENSSLCGFRWYLVSLPWPLEAAHR